MSSPYDDERAAAEAALGENVLRGFLEVVGVDDDGQLTYRLTAAGRAKVEAMPGSSVPERCPHCEPEHGSPHRVAWAVWVRPERDSDGQPIGLQVQPTNGAHVAEEDAEWLRKVIREALGNCDHTNHGGWRYG